MVDVPGVIPCICLIGVSCRQIAHDRMQPYFGEQCLRPTFHESTGAGSSTALRLLVESVVLNRGDLRKVS